MNRGPINPPHWTKNTYLGTIQIFNVTFWPILDPLPHVSFGDTDTDPAVMHDVTFLIFQIKAFQ